jgi:hypothetical protein
MESGSIDEYYKIMIFAFLEGKNPNGPSADIVKIALLCRKFCNLVLQFYEQDNFQAFATNFAK